MKFATGAAAAIEDDVNDTDPDEQDADDALIPDTDLVDDPASAAAIDDDTTAAEEAVLTA